LAAAEKFRIGGFRPGFSTPEGSTFYHFHTMQIQGRWFKLSRTSEVERMTDRAYFNIKQTKRSNPEARTTLDNLHQLQVESLKKEKEDFESIEKQIADYRRQAEETTDIVIKSQIEAEIDRLKRKKEEWTSNKPMYDYFFETGELLYKYYDLQENIQNGSTGQKIMKAKPGSVLAALQAGAAPGDDEETVVQSPNPTPTATPTATPTPTPTKPSSNTNNNPKAEGREVLLERYLQKIDPEHARNVATTNFDDPHGVCDLCEKEMTFSANEALFFCPGCGYQEFVLIDSDKPSYKDPPREVTYYAYKRINHFNEWLAQFQAKESTEIPEDIFKAILDELRKERITNTEHIKPTKIREILKKLKCTNFYEHVPYILNRINGKTAPVMSREIEEKLRFMFKEIQSSFVKHCPKNRSNFLSYSYVLYKFCELMELDDYLQCFPLLKNRDKLYNQDKIWQKICADLRWEFIRSI
jgi:hypothetical protein